MGTVARFPRSPQPKQEVIDALEAALAAARIGLVHTVLVMTVNPVQEVETCVAGDLTNTGRVFLIRAIYQEAKKLFDERPIQGG